MKANNSFHRLLIVSVTLFCVLFLGSANASHFRFAHFTWEDRSDVAPNTVDFHLTVGFRLSFYFSSSPEIGDIFRPGSFDFGDGSIVAYDYEVIAFSAEEDWIIGQAVEANNVPGVVRHIYPSNGRYTANFTGNARIGELRNSANTRWNVNTLVDLSVSNNSPVSSLPPIVTCPRGACQFLVPAIDNDGDDLTWRFASAAESSISSLPLGLEIDENTGIINWVGSPDSALGLYAVQVIIEDYFESGGVKSAVAIDFIINHQEFATNNPPAFDVPPTPELGATITAMVGQELIIDIHASDPDLNGTVVLNHTGLPVDATFETGTASQTANAQFRWTPSIDDIGQVLLTFIAIDEFGSAGLPHPITIDVQKAALSNVKVIDSISSVGIDIEESLFSQTPFNIEVLSDKTLVEWRFDSFDIDQIENLDVTLKLNNLQPGESRLVVHSLELSYLDENGQLVNQSLGEKVVEVAETLFDLQIAVDQGIYLSGESVKTSVTATNLVGFNASASVQVSIFDVVGNRVLDLNAASLQEFSADSSIDITLSEFDSSDAYVGEYVAKAVLADAATGLEQTVEAPFILVSENGTLVDVSNSVYADQAVYQAWDRAELVGRVKNEALNALFSGGIGNMIVTAPSGAILLDQTVTLNGLSPLASNDFNFYLDLVDAESGDYQVSWQVGDTEGLLLAGSTTSFVVEKEPLQAVRGLTSVDLSQVYHTRANGCDHAVENIGSTTIENLTLSYQLISFDTGLIVSHEQVVVSIEPQESISKRVEIDTVPLAYGGYGCVQMAAVGGQSIDVSAAGFDVLPPRLTSSLELANKSRLLVLLDEPKVCYPLESITLEHYFGFEVFGYWGKSFIVTLTDIDGNQLDQETFDSSYFGETVNSNIADQDLSVSFSQYTGIVTATVSSNSSLKEEGYSLNVELDKVWLGSETRTWQIDSSCERVLTIGNWDDYQSLISYQQNLDLRLEDSAEPNGPINAPDLDQQKAWLENILENAQWPYKIVSNESDFIREFRTGSYQVYALFSENVSLDVWTQKAIREAVNAGAGLIYGGTDDIRHLGLEAALGVHLRGIHGHATAVEVIDESFAALGSIDLPENAQVISAKQHDVTVLALFEHPEHDWSHFDHWFEHADYDHWRAYLRDSDDQSDEGDYAVEWEYWFKDEHLECESDDPYDWTQFSQYLRGFFWNYDACDMDWQALKHTAATINHYGEGEGLYIGFDLLVSSTSGVAAYETMLLNALQMVKPDNVESLPLGPVSVGLSVINLEVETAGRVSLEIVNSTLIGADEFLNDESVWRWDFTIEEDQTLEQFLIFDLPPIGEETTVTALIQSNRDGVYLDQESRGLVFSADRERRTLSEAIDIASQIVSERWWDGRYISIYLKLLYIQESIDEQNFEWAYNSLLMTTNLLLWESSAEARELRLIIDEVIPTVAREL